MVELKSKNTARWFLNIDLFAQECLDFRLDSQQAALLKGNPWRCILNCTRQWGKSCRCDGRM